MLLLKQKKQKTKTKNISHKYSPTPHHMLEKKLKLIVLNTLAYETWSFCKGLHDGFKEWIMELTNRISLSWLKRHEEFNLSRQLLQPDESMYDSTRFEIILWSFCYLTLTVWFKVKSLETGCQPKRGLPLTLSQINS